jgi:hypothetical protein
MVTPQGHTSSSAPDHLPIPRTEAYIDLTVKHQRPSSFSVKATGVPGRLFDVHANRTEYTPHGDKFQCHLVKRKCNKCKALNETTVTVTPGEPLGYNERWICQQCGYFLAAVDAVRGRLTIRVGAKQDVRVTVGEAVAVFEEYLSSQRSSDDGFDDVPF